MVISHILGIGEIEKNLKKSAFSQILHYSFCRFTLLTTGLFYVIFLVFFKILNLS